MAEKSKIALGVLIFPDLQQEYNVADDSAGGAAPPDLPRISGLAVANNPVRAAEATVQASRYDVTVAKYGYLPSFAVDIFYGINATNRLTFAAFPIIGYSLTSDKIPQTRLWELATYTMKPRLNRVNGVSMVVIQGGQEPEFQIQPDPAKLMQSQTTVPAILDAVARSNLIDSPGMIENNHQLVLGLVSGQTRTTEEIADIVLKTTGAGLPIRVGDVALVKRSVKPVYTAVTADGKHAVLLNLFRQPESNTVR